MVSNVIDNKKKFKRTWVKVVMMDTIAYNLTDYMALKIKVEWQFKTLL